MYFLKPILPVCLLFFLSCDVGTDCTTGLEPAVTLFLKDKAANGEIVEGKGIGILRDGNFSDTMEFHGDNTQMSGGYERAGKYSIEIEIEGYEKWTKENVVVPQGDCGPVTQHITIFLIRK